MKKILSLSSSKIFIVATLGLFMTLGGFWHHQMNQGQFNRLQVLESGLGTCFSRVSQTFTAMMIKDVHSPYLHQGFMGLSNECLKETVKGINPFKKNVGKGYQTLNQMISETHWFHEKVNKINAPLAAGKQNTPEYSNLTQRFSKIEEFKMNLVDEIETVTEKLKALQKNDEYLMGAGLLLFVLALSILSLQEFNRIQNQKEIEAESMNYLKAGNAQVSAIVDSLIQRALEAQNMPVTAQIFRDYHERLLENKNPVVVDENVTEAIMAEEVLASQEGPVVSLKEALVTLQNIHAENVQINDVRDVDLSMELDSIEEIMNASVNMFLGARLNQKKIMVTNQIHSDRTILSFFLEGASFEPAEIAFAKEAIAASEGIDLNLVILRELVQMNGLSWHLENKTNRKGRLTGMNIRLILPRSAKSAKTSKNLVSIFKGKKRDLAREMLN
jgi:hypothetical protein